MQFKNISAEFEKYGSVYETPLNLGRSGMINRNWHLIAKRYVTSLPA